MMALQWPSSLFSTSELSFSSSSRRPTSEVHFSRWNNANAQKFLVRERTQKEIEDEIRRERRFESATSIVANDHGVDTYPSSEKRTPALKSFGTPSSPSLPSIPGKASKYSKVTENPKSRKNPESSSHPAFRSRPIPKISTEAQDIGGRITIGDNGVAYRIPNAPFEFQYSYTETPKVKPLAMREPYLPFGPGTMPRPWTGRAPLPASKKKLPEFDSFCLPPPNKKGVKPVQSPGPFLAGSGPKYTTSREEILGEPLTPEEIKDLIQGCLKTRRQLNMGRDGLTHNMLENIHAHWKRKRVCKIKCLGVCTVDMDNVRQQLEEKTGGKVIYARGGVLYLFRGRNYNYKTRPKYPLMLWKPAAPVYPKLVKQAPEGLSKEEANEMRERGKNLPAICKLGKNGVYHNLVKDVREAFEECDLVRINCQGMNNSDFKKIGAKLKDLVPCVLISFEREHILVWRGKDWKSLFSKPGNSPSTSNKWLGGDGASGFQDCPVAQNQAITAGESMSSEEIQGIRPVMVDIKGSSIASGSTNDCISEMVTKGENGEGIMELHSQSRLAVEIEASTHIKPPSASDDGQSSSDELKPDSLVSGDPDPLAVVDTLGLSPEHSSQVTRDFTEGVLKLWRQAIESGRALVLDDSLDANLVLMKSIELARRAPPGPSFRNRFRKVVVTSRKKNNEEDQSQHLAGEEGNISSLVDDERVHKGKKASGGSTRKDFKYEMQDLIPKGSLGIDELAKLLA